MNFLDQGVSDYLRRLAERSGDAVVAEMEARAEERGFPIVGRTVGSALEVFARSVGARRVFELGSGYGYSGYWFARAVGEGGEVVLTDADEANVELARGYLTRAGLWDRCRFLVGDAVSSLEQAEGEFDVVYCDIDKGDYPQAFAAARARIRVGGLYLCDNVLWSGRVAREDGDAWTQAIREHNEAVFSDPDYRATIVPLRDGVVVALRVR